MRQDWFERLIYAIKEDGRPYKQISEQAGMGDEGVLNLDEANVLRISPFLTTGTPIELLRAFGGKPGFEQAVQHLQQELYVQGA